MEFVPGIEYRNLELHLQRDIHDFKGSNRYECISGVLHRLETPNICLRTNHRCETQTSSFTAEVRAAHKPFENLHEINSGSGFHLVAKTSPTISRVNIDFSYTRHSFTVAPCKSPTGLSLIQLHTYNILPLSATIDIIIIHNGRFWFGKLGGQACVGACSTVMGSLLICSNSIVLCSLIAVAFGAGFMKLYINKRR